jgi:uncharacterized protein
VTSATAPKPTRPSRTRRVIAISLVVIALLVAVFFIFANVYADWLWYSQLGFLNVLTTQWVWRIGMFVVGFLGMAVPTWLVINLAYRLRPVYVRLSSQLDRYQEVVEPLRRLAMWGIPIFFGLFAGFASSAQWQTAALWVNGVHTATGDPQFNLDTGFYLFALPFYSAVLAFASAVVLICLLLTAAVSYLYGSVRVGQRELRISRPARVQLAIIAGVYLLLQAVSLWLDRYKTLTSADDRITGAAYVSVNATIPGLAILSIVAVLVAILFFVTAVIGRWRYPLIATALLIITSLVVGVGYPWIVNLVQVRPNQLSVESQYYQRNIDGTKAGFGLSDLQETNFSANTTAQQGQLRSDAETTAQIRIMDPAIIPPTVAQLEQYRSYYQFQSPLSVDRYTIDGQTQDTLVSVRDLNLNALGTTASTWQNTSLIYTHGYGLVVAKGNARTSDGNPVFLERGIPSAGFLTSGEKYEPRVYFSANAPTYSIVGAPAGTAPIELDYPAGDGSSTETKTTFDGNGGPNIGNVFNRLIYAIKFQAEQILFSDSINQDSQILYDRDPATRVQKIAPYLTLDGEPYPSVVDGRIVWIVDGYTTSDQYPYSTTTSMSQAIADANNPTPRVALDNVNYIRNSVKATVDAYDGHVTLYAWDPTDPLLQAWQNVYPSTVKPIADMSADLISHVRYPTDLFKVQRTMLGVYHVNDPQSFYQRDNAWTTPADPTDNTVLQQPYYMTMQMPGQASPTYSMFTSFIPQSDGTNARNVLMGYLAVDSDAGTTAGTKGADYGKLRMLVINASTPVPGPGQVQNTFSADPAVSSFINLLKQGQSQVLNGNLLTLPVGGGLLYVQPVFVQSSGATKLPTLQKVLVAFGSQVAFEDTLTAALDSLFGGNSGAAAGDNGVTASPVPTGTSTPSATPTPSPSASGGTGSSTAYQAALQEAKQAMLDRQAALQAGDWTKYGEADARLTQAINTLLQLSSQ